MSTGEWLILRGEPSIHKCQIPGSIGPVFGGISLQKRHAGSVWKCECGLMYEWSGKKWKDTDYAVGR